MEMSSKCNKFSPEPSHAVKKLPFFVSFFGHLFSNRVNEVLEDPKADFSTTHHIYIRIKLIFHESLVFKKSALLHFARLDFCHAHLSKKRHLMHDR